MPLVWVLRPRLIACAKLRLRCVHTADQMFSNQVHELLVVGRSPSEARRSESR